MINKMKKTKLIGIAALLLALGIVGCGENPGSNDPGTQDPGQQTCVHQWGAWTTTVEPGETTKGSKERTCNKCQTKETQEIAATGVITKYNVVFKDAEGKEISSEKIAKDSAITKPADPTAPANKVFYGWKNNKNGGQIWDFANETLNKVMEDVELEPLFIDAGVNPQYLEAEFVPAITDNGGMDGATYSGGAKGQQFIRSDENYEYGATCEVNAFHYYEDPSTFQPVVSETAPQGAELEEVNPKANNCGYFVHFNYNNGNTFTWNITSSAAADDVVIFARFSAEYGVIDEITNDRYSAFNDEDFQVAVNGTNLKYGNITLHNIPEIGGFLPFQDYLMGVKVSLNAGANVITMKVNNTKTLNGTIASTSPCIDCLKLYTAKTTISWAEARLSNIIK